jgi:2-hydroxychromene-2-carboxylate isomerase
MGDLILFQTLAGVRPEMMAGATWTSGVAARNGPLALPADRPAALPRRSDSRPAFFFDLACPISYIAADRVERLLGDVEWIPVPAHALSAERPDPLETIYEAAELARAARLPLVIPDNFPAAVPSAMRAAAYANEQGAGARFALAASRLAFCGGFDLERGSVLEDVAGAARLPMDEVLAASSEECRDAELQATASLLQSEGMTGLPVVSIGGQWFQGAEALSQAVSWRRSA